MCLFFLFVFVIVSVYVYVIARHTEGSVQAANLVRSIFLEDIFYFSFVFVSVFVFVFVFVIVSVYVYMSLLDTQREALKQPTWLDPFIRDSR